MDPITRASKVFLREAAAHWKARRGHVLFLKADASSKGDLVKTLRLAELSPACRRPLFLFEQAFADPDGYFAGLSASLVQDYRALRQGAAEEGVSLAELADAPRLDDKGASTCALVGFRAREIGGALAGKLEGIDIALVPGQTAAPLTFREAVAALAAELAGSGARLLVLSTPGGPLSDMAKDRSAHFLVDPDELADYLKNLGTAESNGPPVPSPPAVAPGEPGANDARASHGKAANELRGLLLEAAKASRKGAHAAARRLFEQARARSAAEGWLIEEAAVLVALAGAHLAAGAPDAAAASYQEAFVLATRKEASALAAQAALGEGAVRMQQQRYPEALAAYSAATEAADRGQIPMLQAEARRMAETAALAADVPMPPDPAPTPTPLPAPTPTPPGVSGEGEDAASESGVWVTGPVDLSRLNLPVLPFDHGKKP